MLQGLTLALNCLSFDFVGTCLDDSAEDLSTIQVPSGWRSIIEEPSTLQLFLDYYLSSKPPLSNAALECLVRLASVRRSLFTNETERSKFLNRLVNGTRDILVGQKGLADHANYHEFCRLLGRLKTNYQLSELVSRVIKAAADSFVGGTAAVCCLGCACSRLVFAARSGRNMEWTFRVSVAANVCTSISCMS